MYITKERYDELISGIVGFKMFKDVLNNNELTSEEKIDLMDVIVKVKEENNDNIRCY